jgi:hypothetical protein
MSSMERSPGRIIDIILPLVAGLVIGYMAHDFFTPASESSGLSASSESNAIRPSLPVQSGERIAQVALQTEAKQPKEISIGQAARHQSPVMYERFSDGVELIQDLHENMPEPEFIVGRRELDLDPVNPDGVDLITETMSEDEEAYLYQSELIAVFESQHAPPELDLDEGEVENPYQLDGLLEIEDWEEAEIIQDDMQSQALQDPENLTPPDEEPLPPLE